MAQTPQPPQRPAPPGAGVGRSAGTVDIGGLFTATDGDEARYERYRDLRDGAVFELPPQRETGSLSVRRERVARRLSRPALQRRFRAAARVNFGFQWTSLPLNYSYLTRTPFDRPAATR